MSDRYPIAFDLYVNPNSPLVARVFAPAWLPFGAPAMITARLYEQPHDAWAANGKPETFTITADRNTFVFRLILAPGQSGQTFLFPLPCKPFR